MTRLDNVKIIFPDKFGIKDTLRSGNTQNSEFFNVTLKSYDILSSIKNQKLSIVDSLKANQNVSIFDHQILAAQKIKNSMGGTAMLADEVGLGKTVEAGIVIKEFLTVGLAKKILILAPPSLLQQWQDEMSSKFDLDFIIHRNDPRFENIASHDLLIMSHASATYPKQSIPLNNIYWDLVVVDEAHSMKNAETHKHIFVRNLPKRNLLLLTATPIQNNLEEMYNLVDLMHPGCLGTWKQFRDKYVGDTTARTIQSGMRDQLQKEISKFIIRTTRKEVRRYVKFTDRVPHTDILNPSDEESKLYNMMTDIIRDQYEKGAAVRFALMTYQRLTSSSTEASKRALYRMKESKLISDSEYDELMSHARSIRIDSKLSRLLEIIHNQSSKFLIFTEFYATQDHIAQKLTDEGYTVTLFNGKMSSEEKHESVNLFRGDAQIMISTSAGGEGQNFQFCHNIVNYDLPWNPMRVEQRIGRVHRIGQESDVHIFNFALVGTIEAYILELLYTKINLFKMSLGDMDLLFEESWSAGSTRNWFEQYMNVTTEQERKNIFTALGDNWNNRKETVSNAIQDFNADVFANFDLSSLGTNQK